MNEIIEIKTWLFILVFMGAVFYGAFIYIGLIPLIEKWINNFLKNLEDKNGKD